MANFFTQDKSLLNEAKIENAALQNQIIELKKIVKGAQKQAEDLSRQNLEKEKQIQELTHLNKTNERVVKHLRERAEESAREIKNLQQEGSRPEEEKRKALLLQTQLKEKQNELAKFLEIAQAKEVELQKTKELLRLQNRGNPENEFELKAAQKHLAKKMKEANDLAELNEKYLQKISELEESDRRNQKEKNELKERAAKWQKLSEEAESKITYFKAIEAKYHKLQGLIHNLDRDQETPKSSFQEDLFALNKPAPLFKESLFE